MRTIDRTPRQTAVMLCFPEGVRPEQAQKFLDVILRGVPDDRKPEVAQVQEFNPDFGGVTLYQP